MDSKKLLGICCALAMVGITATGCDPEVSQPTSCDDVTCEAGQVCDPVSFKCVDDTPVEEDKCKDVTCDEGQTCNKDTGKCEGGSEPEVKCDNGKSPCGETCVDLMSDAQNCGACGTACGENQTCDNGVCKDEQGGGGGEACDVSEAATCDGNSTKKCIDGEWKTEACGEGLICSEGECISEKECEDDFAPICEGNSVKSCVSGKFQTTDCQGKKCDSGACTEEVFVKECEDGEAASCDEASNSVKTCVSQKYEYQNCGTLSCVEGECKEVITAECDDTFTNVCDETGVKSCVDGKFVSTACDNGQVCIEGECKSMALDDLCPDDPDKKEPGTCGCNVPDIDADNNGIADCKDLVDSKVKVDFCPDDPDKTLPGICGCNIPDKLSESTGNPLCLEAKDLCPNDPNKTVPGVCGCNIPDTINELTGLPWCVGKASNNDSYHACAGDDKYLHGACGCEVADSLKDDVTPSCVPSEVEEDACPDDDNKTNPGACGCGAEDTDSDGDGVADCIDACPNDKYNYFEYGCECGKIHVTIDSKDYCATPIETAEDFINIRNGIMKGTIKNTANETYALMNDIDLGTVFESSEVEWVSVDNFKGKLVSAGKTISYTQNNSPATLKCTGSKCGLFNSLSGARIHNIKLNFNIVGKSGTAYTGMLAGDASSSTISSIEAVGNVSGSSSYTGGLIGRISGTISNVSHEGDVTVSAGERNGGLFGQISSNSVVTTVSNKGDVTNTAKGSHTGGISGLIDSNCTVSDVTYEGTVTGGNNYTGGIFGYAGSNITLSNATASGKVIGHRLVGGISGRHYGNMNNIVNNCDVEAYNDTGSWGMYTGGVVGQGVGGYKYENITNNGNVTSTCEFYDYIDSNGNPGKHSGSCCMVGGVFGIMESTTKGAVVSNVTNNGNVTGGKSAYYGGIFGYGYSAQFSNIVNNGKIVGGEEVGGIAGMLQMIGTPAEKGIEFKFENVVNTGDVEGTSAYNGGIIGYFATRYQDVEMTFNQIVNKGNVSGTSYQGGFVGLFRQNGTTNITDVYSTGNVTARGARDGGLIGSLHINDESWQNGTSKRAMNVNLNRVYAKGDVKGTSEVGGLVGYIYTDAYNRTLNGGTYERIECPTNSNVYTNQYTYSYYDYDLTVTIMNAYANGKVTGTGSNIGGLIGYVGGSTTVKSYTNRYYKYDDSCQRTYEDRSAGTAKGVGKLILANAFAAGQVTGVNANAGGLAGQMYYNTNEVGASANWIINNVYATGNVQETAGALLGTKPNTTNITFKNTYYWPESGSSRICGAGAMEIANVVPFTYDSAVPVLENGDKLTGKLNSNRAASTAPELGSDISEKWVDKKQQLINNMSVTIPQFDFEPVDWQKAEEGDENQETGRE